MLYREKSGNPGGAGLLKTLQNGYYRTCLEQKAGKQKV
jgi:hypothetical protein